MYFLDADDISEDLDEENSGENENTTFEQR